MIEELKEPVDIYYEISKKNITTKYYVRIIDYAFCEKRFLRDERPWCVPTGVAHHIVRAGLWCATPQGARRSRSAP
jgi:hypothetical protein